mgnify:FL=1
MKKPKLIGMIIGIVLFIGLVVGLAYAWFSWNSSNLKASGGSKCFVIDYTISQEIGANQSATLKYGEKYTDGQYASVIMGLNSRCSGIKAVGTLYLNTNTVGTDDNILNGGLKYTVVRVNGSTKEVLKEDKITTRDKITLLSDIDLTTTYTYEVWVWLDGTIAGNEYHNSSYSGYITAEAEQVE